jgi:hypothetical protein
VRLSVSIDEHLAQRIRALADADGVSVSRLVQRVLSAWLARGDSALQPHGPDPETPAQRPGSDPPPEP